MLKGEYLHKGHTGGHQPFLDDHPVKLFTAQPDSSNVHFEMTNMAVQRMQSRMKQVEEAYHKRNEKIQASVEEEETLREKGMKMMEDLAELTEMERRLQAKLDGPPQRRATHAEIISSHNRKVKRARIAQARQDITKQLDNMRKGRERDEKVVLQLARRLVRFFFPFFLSLLCHVVLLVEEASSACHPWSRTFVCMHNHMRPFPHVCYTALGVVFAMKRNTPG